MLLCPPHGVPAPGIQKPPELNFSAQISINFYSFAIFMQYDIAAFICREYSFAAGTAKYMKMHLPANRCNVRTSTELDDKFPGG